MQTFTILIVEDEPYIADELEANAQDCGYAVIKTNTTQEALDAINNDVFHLALLDIKLEGEDMDGVDLAHIIRKKHNIPIVFLTAYAKDPEIKARAETAQYDGFLEKGAFDIMKELGDKFERGAEVFRAKKTKDKNGEYDYVLFGADGSIIINTDVRIKDLEKGGYRLKKRRVILHVDEINYITTLSNRIKLVTDKGVFELSTSLKKFKGQIKDSLPDEEHNKLYEAHQSSIVNFNKVVAYDRWGGVHYVYFNVEDSDEEGVPVRSLFIQLLEEKLPRIFTKRRK